MFEADTAAIAAAYRNGVVASEYHRNKPYQQARRVLLGMIHIHNHRMVNGKSPLLERPGLITDPENEVSAYLGAPGKDSYIIPYFLRDKCRAVENNFRASVEWGCEGGIVVRDLDLAEPANETVLEFLKRVAYEAGYQP